MRQPSPPALAILCALVLLGAACPERSSATVFFVRESGSDEENGLTPETAFATIARGASAFANAGDRVVVGPGSYPEGNITPAWIGIERHPIVFQADPTGALTGDVPGPVVIRPPLQDMAGFLLLGRRYVEIDGFRIEGASGPGIQVRSSILGVNSAHVTIRNVEVRDGAGRGIDVSAEGRVVIEGTVVTGSGSSGITVLGCAAPLALCASTPAEATNVVLDHSRAEMSGAHGMFVADVTTATITNNELRDNGGSGLQVRSSTGVVIRGNLVESNKGDGIEVGSEDGARPSANIDVAGNEVGGNGKAGIALVVQGTAAIEDNVVYDSMTTGIAVMGDAQGERPVPRVTGNTARSNASHGIFLSWVHDGSVINNRALSNGASGVTLRAADGMLVANNLVYANADNGIAVGTGDLGALNAAVANNTVYANGGWGFVLGSAYGDSPGGIVVDNIVAANVDGGIAVSAASAAGYVAGFNVIADAYGERTPANVYDIIEVPLFVDPAGADGVLGGEGFADDNFRLRDELPDLSPGIDAGSTTVEGRGITGSAAASGTPDRGVVDAGYHYGVDAQQVLNVQAPFMPLYVRVSGEDGRSGKSPEMALATIGAAAEYARAGITVIVGPGRYVENNIHPPKNRGRASFVADPGGIATGDSPGAVLLDADGAEKGFVLLNAAFAVVDGFHLAGVRRGAGIQVRLGSDHAMIRNNIVFSNRRLGILVSDAGDVKVTNNLVYANLTGCVQLTAAPRALVSNNTCYGNIGNGITVGAVEPAPCARVRYNVVQGNGDNGIQVGSNTIVADSLLGYDPGYNINTDGYGAGTPRPDSDLSLDPLLVDPAGTDGLLGEDGFEDDSFQLAQVAAGQGLDSPGVDFAPVTVGGSEVEGRSTRSDAIPDSDRLDLGFHYRAEGVPLAWLNPDRPVSSEDREFPEFCYEELCTAGDCNGDGEVTVDELVTAVRIGLGESLVEECLAADRDGNGEVAVNELIAMVNAALGCVGTG